MNKRAFYLTIWGAAAVLWSALIGSRAVCDQSAAKITVDTVASPDSAVVDSTSAAPKSPLAQGVDSLASETPRPSTSSSCIAVNTAGQTELESLPGIGPVIAARIIASRENDGAFERAEDLRRVKGIGPARLGKIRDLVCF